MAYVTRLTHRGRARTPCERTTEPHTRRTPPERTPESPERLAFRALRVLCAVRAYGAGVRDLRRPYGG
ncbi:hypothetical protein D7M15_09955 [Streptomyces sp. Z26]|nr:hypothetical protein D7M15_09955 [Streptomyces sp. Z26]